VRKFGLQEFFTAFEVLLGFDDFTEFIGVHDAVALIENCNNGLVWQVTGDKAESLCRDHVLKHETGWMTYSSRRLVCGLCSVRDPLGA
jgi:hypothetical protein